MRLLNTVEEGVFPNKTQRIAEMKFIRGWIYLGMKFRWKYVPYISDTTAQDAIIVQGNRIGPRVNQ